MAGTPATAGSEARSGAMHAPTIPSTPIRRSSRCADEASVGAGRDEDDLGRDRLQPAEPRRERAPAVDVEAAGDMGGGVGRAGPHVEDHGRAGGAGAAGRGEREEVVQRHLGRGSQVGRRGNHALRGAIAAK